MSNGCSTKVCPLILNTGFMRVPATLEPAGNAARNTSGFSHLVKFLNVAIGDPPTLQGLNGTALQHQITGLIATELYQLHARRADIQPEHWSWLTAKQRPY